LRILANPLQKAGADGEIYVDALGVGVLVEVDRVDDADVHTG
jgi:hypothetical protein